MGNIGPTILVVEDNVVIRLNTAARLRKWGYKVMEAGNGLAGLEIVKIAPQVAMVLTDLNMPEMDGITMTEQIRALKRELPVILYSTKLLPVTTHYAREAGVTEIVSKDDDAEILLAAVKKCLASAKK